MTPAPADKSHRGNASQFFVAGELCRRGWMAVVTMGNCPNTDVLVSNKAGTKFVHVQVKTFAPGHRTCSVGMKAERDFGENFFWILAGIPTAEQTESFVYYVIPSATLARETKRGFETWVRTPGKNGRPHDGTNTVRTVSLPPHDKDWSLAPYLNRWDLIAERLS